MPNEPLTSNELSASELVKYLDHLARCYRGELGTVKNDPHRFARITRNDERAIQQAADILRAAPETRCVGCSGTLVRPELCDECFLAQKPDENGRTPCPSCGNDTQHGPHMPGCRRANAQKAGATHQHSWQPPHDCGDPKCEATGRIACADPDCTAENGEKSQ